MDSKKTGFVTKFQDLLHMSVGNHSRAHAVVWSLWIVACDHLNLAVILAFWQVFKVFAGLKVSHLFISFGCGSSFVNNHHLSSCDEVCSFSLNIHASSQYEAILQQPNRMLVTLWILKLLLDISRLHMVALCCTVVKVMYDRDHNMPPAKPFPSCTRAP